jgi:shikimate dehydrogenase
MTQRFVLLGHPLGHSLSPVIHRAAYRELGLDATYELMDCPDEAAVQRQFGAIKAGVIDAANVTVPHKRLALSLSDAADSSALDVGAANVLVRRQDGRVMAHNTDVPALAEELLVHAPRRERVVVIGSGGAALAAVAAASKAGAQKVFVVARSFRPSSEPWPAAPLFERLGATLVSWPLAAPAMVWQAWSEVARHSQVFIQATSAGMQGAEPGEGLVDLVPWGALEEQPVVLDLVYNPQVTPLLQVAAQRGLPAVGGLFMLLRQAALAIELWTGKRPSLEPMHAAALQALRSRK